MVTTSIGRRTIDGTTGAAALEIIGAYKGTWLRELQITLATAVASTFGLGRPAAIGGTPTTPVINLVGQGGEATAKTSTAVAWAVGPTAPTAFFRRITLPATIGAAGPNWVFAGLFIPAGASLVVWNLAANGVADISVVVDEPYQ